MSDEWQALQSWEHAVGRLRRAAHTVFSEQAMIASDVGCKFEVADALFAGRALPDTEWAYVYAEAWIHELDTEARRFGLRVKPVWARNAAAFDELPDAAFYAVLGRLAGRAA